MDVSEYLGLNPTHNPHRWYLPVVEGISTLERFLFGGCGLGAAIAALEATLGRPVVWATGQYLSFATVGEVMDVDVTVATAGHYTSQARVTGHVGDREILTVNAALGARPAPWDGQWEQMPDVPPPEACESRQNRLPRNDSIMARMDIRLAKGRQFDEFDGTPTADGTSALWIRLPEIAMSAGALAILGDYVPYGIAQALGTWTRSNSLDNTLRIVRLVPTEWVLLDIRIHGVTGGFGHGLVHLWAQDGTLLATASQSAIVRELPHSG